MGDLKSEISEDSNSLRRNNDASSSCFHFWLSLRLVFTILITFLVIITTGLTMTILIVTQKSSWEATFTRELTSQSKTVSLLIASLLRVPERSTKLVTSSLQLKDHIDIWDVTTVRRTIWPSFSSEFNFDGMFMNLLSEYLVGYQRGTSQLLFYVGNDYSDLATYAPIDSVNGTGPLLSDHGKLSRLSPKSLLTSVGIASASTWTDVSIDERGVPFMTYSCPLYNTSGVNDNFIGIIFVDYLLSEWSEHLRSIDVGNHGIIYIMKDDGAIIASSHANITSFSYDRYAGRHVRNYATSNAIKKYSPLVFHSSRFLIKPHIKNEQVYHLQLPQRNADLTVVRREVQLEGGIKWYIVIVFSKNDFVRDYLNADIAAYTVAPVLVALSCLIGFLVTYGITRQISSLSGMMRDVANMNLDHINLDMKPSYMAELGHMQMAFVKMVRNMIEFRAFMPDNVFNELLEDSPRPATATNQVSPCKDPIPCTLYRRGSNPVTDTKATNSDIDLNKLGLGLKEKNISLLSVQIINFYDLLGQVGNTDFVHMHGDLVQEITAIVQQRKGVILNFTHSEITAIWSTNKPSDQCNPIHASKCAVQILTRLRNYNQKNDAQNLPGIELKIAVASGIALVGNMGTSKMRKFSIIGNIVARLQAIQSLQSSTAGNRIFFDETTKEVCRRIFLTTPVLTFSLELRRSADDSNSAAATPTIAAIPILTENYLTESQHFCVFKYEGDKQTTNNAEWMYEMEAQQMHQDYEVVDDAFRLFFVGSYCDALKRLDMTELTTPSCVDVAEKLRSRIMEILGQ